MTTPAKSAQSVTQRALGNSGPRVFPIALGCMGMSGMYGASDEREGIATIHAAVERGVNLLDTGDFYGQGHNEMLIGRALREGNIARDRVLLSVKFGGLRGPDGAFIGIDTRPVAIKNFLGYSLKRLGVDYIDIYRPARLDPHVPIEETVGAIADLIKAGYVRHLGLSEIGVDTLKRAHAVQPVVDLQIEYGIVSRGPEARILPALEETGSALTAYGVLSRGLLTGAKPAGPGDFRAHLPRFSGDSMAKNQRLIDALNAIARDKRVTPAQLCIAWVLAKSPRIVPVVGARTRKQLEDSLAAVSVQLSAEEIKALEGAVPAEAVAGTRYDTHQMAMLDSER
jgi:aryl-alcohol dehydrogenase-like predicted oxidoreductase